jgi:hypothetical protein
MKTAGVILAVSLALIGFLAGIAAAETIETTAGSTPDLTGIWEVTMIGHTKTEGFVENTITYNITEQKGQAFTGVKDYTRISGEAVSEGFSGIITDDGMIYIGDYLGGVSIGKLTGSDTVEFVNFEDRDDAKALIMKGIREKP